MKTLLYIGTPLGQAFHNTYFFVLASSFNLLTFFRSVLQLILSYTATLFFVLAPSFNLLTFSRSVLQLILSFTSTLTMGYYKLGVLEVKAHKYDMLTCGKPPTYFYIHSYKLSGKCLESYRVHNSI